MVKVYIPGRMDRITRAHIRMISNMAKENINPQIVFIGKVSGNKGRETEWAS